MTALFLGAAQPLPAPDLTTALPRHPLQLRTLCLSLAQTFHSPGSSEAKAVGAGPAGAASAGWGLGDDVLGAATGLLGMALVHEEGSGSESGESDEESEGSEAAGGEQRQGATAV